MTTKKKLMTAEELLRLEEEHEDKEYELLDGELVEFPMPGMEHEALVVNVVYALEHHVRPRRLGRVVGAVGIWLRRGPDRVRMPDVCFFSAGRIPGEQGYTGVVPDFIVEIISADRTAEYVQQKMEEWVAAGVRLAWAVYPETRSVVVYRGLDDIKGYQQGEVLDGAPVLPEFTLPVAELFA